jgi:hypothetical protein
MDGGIGWIEEMMPVWLPKPLVASDIKIRA